MIDLLLQLVGIFTDGFDFILNLVSGIIDSLIQVIQFLLSAIDIFVIFMASSSAVAYLPSVMVIGLGIVLVASVARVVIQLL